MQDRVNLDIGAEERLTEDTPSDWATIDWAAVNQRVKNLRQRIYRATQKGQWNRVRSLTKLMMRSHANLLLSTRRVTQDNKGKKTPGVDCQVALTPESRARVVQEMKEYKPWHVKPARRVYIPKANGKQRPLGIPILKDRITQAVIKNALEPRWEALFEANSYGFRPGRSCHDAIEQCWGRLNSNGGHAWILDADIKGAFDNISHDFILNAIGQTPGRGWIKEWLKAGYVEAEIFHPTDSGTPQGGVISPLLANIALDGMDRWLSRKTKQRTYTYKSGKQGGQTRTHIVERYGFIRYADDFVITAETREEIEAIKPQVVDWLTERGLQLSEDKTRIRHISEGFDFLGFNVRRYGTKCLTKPQTEKVHAKLREIKSWLDKHPNVKPDAVIDVLNPILYGWANYYKHGVSKEVFAYFDQRMIQMLMRWTKKRHPKKGIRWIISRYFTRVGGDNWIFYARTTDRRGKPTVHHLYKVAHTKIVRHVKVRDIASPDDPTMTDYWAARATKQGKTYLDDAPQRRQLAERQKWLCPVCREHLFNGERRNVHHIERVTDGGTDEQDNLQLIHDACHKQIHSGRAKKESVGA